MYKQYLNIICYDKITVKYFFPNKEFALAYQKFILHFLSNSHYKQDTEIGKQQIDGYYNGIWVNVTDSYILMKGSVAKSMFGNNYYAFSLTDLKKWIDSIDNVFALKVSEAPVTSMEFSGNIFTDEKPENYFKILGSSGRNKQWQKFSSKYFEGAYRNIIIYDKVKELKSDRQQQELAEEISEKNVFRFEVRYLKKLSKQLGRNVILKDLYDDEFFRQMIELYRQEYVRIHKNNFVQPTLATMRSNDGKDYLLSYLVAEKGVDEVNEIVRQMKSKFTPVEHSRFKTALKKLKYLSEPSPLLTELDTKINELINNTLKVNFTED